MGTHPIFESDFDCLTDILSRTILRHVRMALTEGEIAARSVQADQLIASLQAQIEEIKQQAPLPAQIQETILKQENAQLRKVVEALKAELTQLEVRNGKIQVALPKPAKAPKQKKSEKPVEKPAAKQEKKEEKPKQEKAKQEKKSKPAKQAAAAPADDKPVDVSRLSMKVGKIIECVKHPDADALYLEKIECGEEKPRQVISGLVKHIPIDEMQNRSVIILCNLKPAKMRGIMSEAMVMCASTPEKVEILAPPAGAAPGDVVTVPGFEGTPDELIKPTNKKAVSIFEQVAPDLKTNDAKQATYKGVAWEVKGKGPITAQSLTNVQVK